MNRKDKERWEILLILTMPAFMYLKKKLVIDINEIPLYIIHPAFNNQKIMVFKNHRLNLSLTW